MIKLSFDAGRLVPGLSAAHHPDRQVESRGEPLEGLFAVEGQGGPCERSRSSRDPRLRVELEAGAGVGMAAGKARGRGLPAFEKQNRASAGEWRPGTARWELGFEDARVPDPCTPVFQGGVFRNMTGVVLTPLPGPPTARRGWRCTSQTFGVGRASAEVTPCP